MTFIRFSPAVRGSFVPLRQPDIFRQPPLLMLIKYSGLKAAPEYDLIRRAAHAMMPAGRRAALLEIAYTYKRLAQDFIEKVLQADGVGLAGTFGKEPV